MQSPHSSTDSPTAPRGRAVRLSGGVEVVLGNPRHNCRFQGICRIDILPLRVRSARAACPHDRSPLNGRFRLWPAYGRCLLLLPYRELLPVMDQDKISVWAATPLYGARRNRFPRGYLLPGRYQVSRAGGYAYLLLHWRPGRPDAGAITKN